VEAEELKGEKGAGTLRRDRNFTNGIVCPHPPRAHLGILMTALIVLVAGYGASRSLSTMPSVIALRNRHRVCVLWIHSRRVARWFNLQMGNEHRSLLRGGDLVRRAIRIPNFGGRLLSDDVRASL